MKKLKVGVVGLGRVASKTHIPVLNSLKDVEVVAGAENNAERAERVKKVFGLQAVYSSYEEMFAKAGLDAVYVCLPNFLHKDACEKALRSGLHVLCEKPMGISSREAEELDTLAREKGLVLMPGYKKRYAGNFAKARRMIQEGVLGKVVHIQGTFMTPGPYISWDPKSDWYLDEKWQGVVYDSACHLVELLLYVFPGQGHSFRTIADKGFRGYKTPTNIATVFTMGDSTICDLAIGWRASTDFISIAIHGTAGSIIVSRDSFSYLNPGTDPVDKIKIHFFNGFRDCVELGKKIVDKVRGQNFYQEDLTQSRFFREAILGAGQPVGGREATEVHRILESIVSSIA